MRNKARTVLSPGCGSTDVNTFICAKNANHVRQPAGNGSVLPRCETFSVDFIGASFILFYIQQNVSIWKSDKMTDTKDINVLRNEVREIQAALTELTFTNERNKVILKQSEENLRACYALVQRGEATLEEFDDFVTKLDDLRFSISETEKVIKCTRNLLNNKIEELNPLETAENKKIATSILVVTIGFIIIAFLVFRAVSLMFGISWLEAFGWIAGIIFALSTIICLFLFVFSIFLTAQEKLKKK